MNMYRFYIFLLGLGLLSGANAIATESFVPASDDSVLLELPEAGGHPLLDEAARLRDELSASPRNTKLAAKLAGIYLRLAAELEDARYNGYARALLHSWQDADTVPAAMLLVRARLRQQAHEFDAALADLKQLDRRAKWHARRHSDKAEARLLRASIYQARGDYRAALNTCKTLFRVTNQLTAATCAAAAAGHMGRAASAYRSLLTLSNSLTPASPRQAVWTQGVLADLSNILGRSEQAESHLREALKLGIFDKHVVYAYADALLARRDYPGAYAFLRGLADSDDALLRLCIVEKALAHPDLMIHRRKLEARFELVDLRGDNPHWRVRARYALDVTADPARALSLALRAWREHKEPEDARLLMQAALANHEPHQANHVIDWMKDTGIEDARLHALATEITRQSA